VYSTLLDKGLTEFPIIQQGQSQHTKPADHYEVWNQEKAYRFQPARWQVPLLRAPQVKVTAKSQETWEHQTTSSSHQSGVEGHLTTNTRAGDFLPGLALQEVVTA
jgi:hypothetical protein